MKTTKKMIPIEPAVLDEVAKRISKHLQQYTRLSEQVWINEQEAMAMIGITSKGSLLKLRQLGKIRFSKILSKNIMYDKHSILELLNANAKEPF